MSCSLGCSGMKCLVHNMNGQVRNVRLCWDFVHYCLEGPVAYENILIYATQEL